jgi:hypothetical protein
MIGRVDRFINGEGKTNKLHCFGKVSLGQSKRSEIVVATCHIWMMGINCFFERQCPQPQWLSFVQSVGALENVCQIIEAIGNQ